MGISEATDNLGQGHHHSSALLQASSPSEAAGQAGGTPVRPHTTTLVRSGGIGGPGTALLPAGLPVTDGCYLDRCPREGSSLGRRGGGRTTAPPVDLCGRSSPAPLLGVLLRERKRGASASWALPEGLGNRQLPADRAPLRPRGSECSRRAGGAERGGVPPGDPRGNTPPPIPPPGPVPAPVPAGPAASRWCRGRGGRCHVTAAANGARRLRR